MVKIIKYFDNESKKVRIYEVEQDQVTPPERKNYPLCVIKERNAGDYNPLTKGWKDISATRYENTAWQINGGYIKDKDGEERYIPVSPMNYWYNREKFILYLIATYKNWEEFDMKAGGIEKEWRIPY